MADFCNQCRAEMGFGDPEDSDYPSVPSHNPVMDTRKSARGAGLFTSIPSGIVRAIAWKNLTGALDNLPVT